MSEKEEAAEVEEPAEVVDQAAETKEPDVSADVLAKAEKMGWTPKDQFRGDPDKWRPADEFVERGENMLPLVRAQVKRQEREIAELKTSIKQFAEYHDKTAQREYAKALMDLREQRAQAIKDGDGVAFDKVDGEIDALKKDVESKVPQQATGNTPEFDAWLSKNKWAEDVELQDVGSAIGRSLTKNGATETGTELLDLITKEIKRRYPERFENPRRNAAAVVEGASGPRKGGGKSYADLPADARAACDRMAKNGYSDKPKEMAAFKAQYTKNYFEE